jgi:hypothetical protein
MDHRCGSRQYLPVRVMLYPRSGDPVRAWVRDVSISGMFVELESGPATMPPQSLVEIEMSRPGIDGRSSRCLAVVARAAADGLALMFDRLNPPAVARLLANQATRPAPRAARPALPAVPSSGAKETALLSG